MQTDWIAIGLGAVAIVISLVNMIEIRSRPRPSNYIPPTLPTTGSGVSPPPKPRK